MILSYALVLVRTGFVLYVWEETEKDGDSRAGDLVSQSWESMRHGRAGEKERGGLLRGEVGGEGRLVGRVE